jgi:hypothetical protein
LAFGAWIGVRMMLMLSLRKIASKAQPNFLSRSWIRSSIRCCRSSSSISRLRACCVIHAVLGVGRARDELDSACREQDEEEHVQSLHPDGLDREEIAGERRRRVLAEK